MCDEMPIIGNQDKSATRFFREVAAQDLDMFFNFKLVKSHKVVNNSATTEAKEKKTDLESFGFL